ncbi:acid phosphatase [Fusarium sp. NRRL 52700]|nr:acid phosphatase [Fusarium sp. NRRL 52700]
MKSRYFFGGVFAAFTQAAPTVDETYPYNGPAIPIGDWVDHTVKGSPNHGFIRLVEPPAVQPGYVNATNNVNVISLSYIPAQPGEQTVGINIHYQTPFGLGGAPSVNWGTSSSCLNKTTPGFTVTYDRTPPCSLVAVTQCSQFFHNVQIEGLQPGTTYFYQIPAANGTTDSAVLSFKTAQAVGDPSQFSIAINNDMGYTNANGTYSFMNQAVKDGELAFVWHGGDLSYADDWYSGIVQCNFSAWPVCYNGSNSSLPNNDTNPDYFDTPLPVGEIPNQGSPRGGDVGVLYESNWDLWQQWMNNITMKIPYIVLPGNHEVTCADHDNTPFLLSSYLNENKTDTPMSSDNPNSTLTYYSCPPSQRNFTAFQNRFSMAGDKSGGVGNFWHSFDYGLVHFVSIDTETDYANSPDKTFREDVEKAKKEEDCKGKDKDEPKCKTKTKETPTSTSTSTSAWTCIPLPSDDVYETDDLEEETYLESGRAHPLRNETYVTDAGPFGYIEGSIHDNKAYQQYQWLKEDLGKVDRCKTPWVIVMGHRPMYSSHDDANYHMHLREAFEKLFLKNKVDLYIAGHVHWYERLKPIRNCFVDTSAIINDSEKNGTYEINPGYSMVHLINGAAGNIENHATINMSLSIPDITAHRNLTSFGFSKLTVHSATTLSWQFIQGHDGQVGDNLTVKKNATCEAYSSSGLSGSSCSSECSGSGVLAWLYCNIYCAGFGEPLKV